MGVETLAAIIGINVLNAGIGLGVWYRLGNMAARLQAVEGGAACLRHCPGKGASNEGFSVEAGTMGV